MSKTTEQLKERSDALVEFVRSMDSNALNQFSALLQAAQVVASDCRKQDSTIAAELMIETSFMFIKFTLNLGRNDT